jgi:hypothetical protein
VATVEEGKAAATGEVVRVEETVAAEKGGATEVAAMAVATGEEGKAVATGEVVRVGETVVAEKGGATVVAVMAAATAKAAVGWEVVAREAGGLVAEREAALPRTTCASSR